MKSHNHFDERFGIKELYRPADKDSEVDIVAVHGLNGDATMTWTAKESKICWLSHPDFLPKYVKNARILVWGYNSSISSFTGAKPSKNRIHDHAQTLIAELYADREVMTIISSILQLEGRTDKPIIFLCHSLGGIVVKRALSYSMSRSSDKIAHYHTIFTCTYGILFFGTPHNGSSQANLLLSLQRLANLTIPRKLGQNESALVSALREESETLQNITDYFVPLMKNFSICFIWEQQKTDLKYKKEYIVEEASAAPVFDDTERVGIASDHSGMVKFEKNTSPGFRLVASILCRYCRNASPVVERKWATTQRALLERRQAEALEILQYINLLPQTQAPS
ncbi:ribonuclease p mrp subunit protein [Rutstroemia sp. NJR-2017a BBW]|nr:ribonuclease p mrp subunit protein [Rutstroemia sp. NJR-2017a BBW]